LHRYFADWYRTAAIEPQPDVLAKRWEAISSLVYSLDAAEALEVVRLFYGSPRTDHRFVERYRDSFKTRDLTFPMRDNDAELRVLAGATIVSLLDVRSGPVADMAALAMACADCRGLRPGERVADILRESRSYLAARSASLRAPKHVKGLTRPSVDLEGLLEPRSSGASGNKPARDADFDRVLEPFQSVGQTKQAFATGNAMEAIQNVASALLEIAAAAAEVTQEHAERLRLQREETNILWWLFAEHSRDLGHAMAALPLPAACLVAGKELADLTDVLPGPLAAMGVLDKMLRVVERELRGGTTAHQAVNEAPREWRSRWLAGLNAEPVEDLCPVICAVRRSIDSDGPDDWVPSVRKVTGVDLYAQVNPLDLATQVYEEALFIGALSHQS
jgi:GTPase-associated system helical domain